MAEKIKNKKKIKKNLTPQELQILIGKDRPLTRKEIATFIKELDKHRKPKKVRHAGHFTDSKLQVEAINQDQNISLFDSLLPSTKAKVEKSNIKIKALGIKLTPSEDKMMNALYKLLHDKSEIRDTQSHLFYAGNEEAKLVPYGGDDKTAKSALIRFKPAELYKEFTGKDDYSGKDIINANSVLFGLTEKKFLIRYEKQRQEKRGNKMENVTDRIEDFQSLLKIMSYIEGMTEHEEKSIDEGNLALLAKREEIIVAFNPIVTDQIHSKYVEYPSDINQRTIIASGGRLRVTESIISLRDYTLREISAKRYTCTLNEDTLINQLRLTSYFKSGRKKIVAQRIDEAIEANKKLGIILDSKKQIGAQGQIKFSFSLNPDFE